MLHHQAILFPGRWERTDPWGLTFYWNHRYSVLSAASLNGASHTHASTPSPAFRHNLWQLRNSGLCKCAGNPLDTTSLRLPPPPSNHPASKPSTLMHSLLPLRAVFSLGILPFLDIPVVFRMGYQFHEVLGKNMSQERFEHRTYPTFTIMCISSRTRSNISKTPNCNKT